MIILAIAVVVIIFFLLIKGTWDFYKKLNKPGWVAFLPRPFSWFYVMDYLEGNGLKGLLAFIPVYHIVFAIKLARAFGRNAFFGIMWLWLIPIGYAIIGNSNELPEVDDHSRGIDGYFKSIITDAIESAKLPIPNNSQSPVVIKEHEIIREVVKQPEMPSQPVISMPVANQMNTTISEKTDSKPKRWICKECGLTNNATRTKCIYCGAAIPTIGILESPNNHIITDNQDVDSREADYKNNGTR